MLFTVKSQDIADTEPRGLRGKQPYNFPVVQRVRGIGVEVVKMLCLVPPRLRGSLTFVDENSTS